MTYRPCINHVVCPAVTRLQGQGIVEDPDSPFFNFSSEAPDPVSFLGIHYYDDYPGPDDPYQWYQYNPGTVGGYFSGTSQQHANDGAVSFVQNEGNGNRQDSPGAPYESGPAARRPDDLVPNEEQTCGADCASGSSSSYTVAAGTIYGETQEEANVLAQSLCDERKGVNTLCITTETLPGACVGDSYDQAIGVEGGIQFEGTGYIYLFGVSSGTLPTGLSLDSNSGAITGAPSTAGNFTFTIEVLDAAFNSTAKQYSVVVTEITSGSELNSGVVLLSYDETVAGTVPAGCTGSWSVTAGSLPPGLSLNASTGQISGTPTAGSKGDYSFTLTLTIDCP